MSGVDPLAVVKARQAGYSDAEIADHLQRTAAPQVQQARTAGYDDKEIIDHLATPPKDDSAVKGLLLGAIKPIDNLSTLAMRIPGMGAIDRFGQKLGMQSQGDAAAHNEMGRKANTRTGYQTLGNIAGTLPTLALRGGMALQGAASGALLSDEKTPFGVAKDAAIGAGSSVIGGGVVKGIAALGRPIASKAATVLHNAGVELSPGQLAQSAGGWIGKAVRGVEDKARSVPILGAFIGGSRDRGATQLNHALANRTLANIGKKAPANLPAGHELLDHTETQLSQAYQNVVPRLVGKIDQQFGADLATAKAGTNVLPATKQKQFQTIVRDVFTNRTKGGATIAGQDLKDAESRLTKLAGDYAKSLDPDQRILGNALFKVRGALRSMAIRSNPDSGQELQAINKGWAQLKQMRKSADVRGVVTPSKLARSAEKSGYGKDLARAAVELMPDHVPNSGTADRAGQMLMMRDLLGSGVAAGGGSAAVLAGHAGTAGLSTATGLAAIAPYTKLGSRAINSIAFAKRPAAVQKGSLFLSQLAKGAPIVAPALLANKSRP